ncbi:hypothetical protein GR255_18380, partial [Mycobacterium tuberculosis]|nr:hypothetical protein [Mycobacterium tuberculosis]
GVVPAPVPIPVPIIIPPFPGWQPGMPTIPTAPPTTPVTTSATTPPPRRRFTCLSAHGCGRDADGAAGRDGRPGRRERPRKAGRKARDRACGPQWPAGQGPPDGAPERTDHETHRRQARSSQAHPAARAQGLRTHSSRREDRCR